MRLHAVIRFLVIAAAGLSLLTVAGTGPASAEDEGEPEGEETPLDQAREEQGIEEGPRSSYALDAATLRVRPAELLASDSGQPIRFELTLERAVSRGTLTVALPASWLRTERSGLRTARPPKPRRLAGGAAAFRRDGRQVVISLEGADAGEVASFELTNIGIPAGTYRLPVSWRASGASGPQAAKATAEVVLYAPVREGLPDPGVAENVSADTIEESESFIAVTPGNSNRVAVGINWQSSSMPAWISTNGGQSWAQRVLPQTFDAPDDANSENGEVCCDPMFAADPLGNIWFGGLSLRKGNAPSRIVVNRLDPASNNFQPLTVGLPRRTGGTQDKPMMTIDNDPDSPTYGRLYVVWDEPASGGINIVISNCDTRPPPSNLANPARCDNADNWTDPVSVTPSTGSYIYADVAVGPDGRVYVTWWDYSALNAIRGDVCNPSSQNCAAASGWGTPQTVAFLNSTNAQPIPFACPIVAQPGGRASPAPGVEVDHSGGANNGRVYVHWGDLRGGSGSTRCSGSLPPATTHLTWDSFVDSAAGALPGGASPSATVGTRLYTDASEGTTSTNSDDWFSWLAVDQTTGQAWVDFYSTRDDATRQKTNFYARSVTPSGSTHTLGPLTKVSAAQSDYSDEPCCTFGNDYGDYTGIAATSDLAYPVWTDNSTGTGDGEAFTFIEATPAPGAPAVVTGSADSIGDTEAVLNGTVNPEGSETDYFFQYGIDNGGATVYSSTPVETLPAGSADVAVDAELTGLVPGTTYRYRLVATNSVDTTTGAEETFETAPAGTIPDTTAPLVSILGRRVQMSPRGVVRVRVRCPAAEADASCDGRLRLKTAKRVLFRGRLRKLQLGAAGFAIPRGEIRRVRLRLKPAKRRLVRRLAPLGVRAIARATDDAGNIGITRKRLRLRAPT